MNTTPRQNGFTLLEVMIALGILAAMALAMFVATQQTLNSKQSTEDRDDANHSIVQALNRMSDDLDMAVIVKSKDLLGPNFATPFEAAVAATIRPFFGQLEPQPGAYPVGRLA